MLPIVDLLISVNKYDDDDDDDDEVKAVVTCKINFFATFFILHATMA